MKKLCLMLGLTLAVTGAAHAQTNQQNRMAACNDAAKTRQLAGDPRKAFMSQCLSSGVPADAPAAQTTQQQRMKDCNTAAAAGGYKGDARQSFMSSCLKGNATAGAGGKQATCTADADARKLAGAARTSFMTKCTAT